MSDNSDQSDLLTRLLLDQSERWRRGQPQAIEVYLRQHPALFSDDDVLLDLISNELFLRTSRGESPDLDEYRRRFPHLAGAMEVQFALHRAVGGHGLSASFVNTGGLKSSGRVRSEPPPEIPGYEISDELGRGGTGVVYKARHLKLGRVVALKVILGISRDGQARGARFRAEAEVVARLQHSNIVQIFEVGDVQGRPWIALELVEGGSLASRMGQPMANCAAAALTETIARAVHYAHQHGIIHRDLKPANILIDAEGRPKVTDFGLAKRLDGSLRLTRMGDVLGTPSYMAPEQARGKQDVGIGVDVYSLGAILYESLTGKPPFRADTAMATLILADTTDPPAPRKLRRRISRDLEAICLKCLRKLPAERYPTAEALADDLRRYQEGRPVTARLVGTATRLAKWVWRAPAQAALAVGTALMTLVVLAALLFHDITVREERDNARGEQQKADAERDAARLAREDAETQRDLAREAARQAEEAKKLVELRSEEAQKARKEMGSQQQRRQEQARRGLYARQLFEAAGAWQHDPERAGRMLQDTASCPLDLRDFTWGLLSAACDRSPRTFHGHSGMVVAIAAAPDGKAVVSGGADGSVRLWDVETGKETVFLAANSNRICAIAFAPNGKTLVSVGADRLVHMWDPTGKSLRNLSGHHGPIFAVAFAPNGHTLATAGDDGEIRLWDMTTHKEKSQISAHATAIHALAFSPDGKTLASAGEDRVVRIWDIESGKLRGGLSGHSFCIYAIAFAPDGKSLASADAGGVVGLWDTVSGGTRIKLPGHQGCVYTLAFAPDGRTLASGAEGFPTLTDERAGEVKLWDTLSGQSLNTFACSSGVSALTYLADGQRLALAVGADVQIRPALRSLEHLTLTGHTAPVLALAVGLEGQGVASGGADQTIVISDSAAGKTIKTIKGLTSPVTALATRFGGHILASGSSDGSIRFWEAATGILLHTIADAPPGVVVTLTFSPDGHTLASGRQDGQIRLWDADTGEARGVMTGHTGRVTGLAWSADGKTLVSASVDGTLRTWRVATKETIRTVIVPGHGIYAFAMTANGQTWATGSVDGTVRLWDAAGGTERLALTGHRGGVWSLAFSPDGRTLAAGAGPADAAQLQAAGEVRLWDPESGQLLAVLGGHSRAVTAVAFTTDRRTLATASLDNTVKIWQAAAQEGLVALPAQAFPVHTVAIPGDGRFILTTAGGLAVAADAAPGAVTLWDTKTGKETGTVKGHAGPVRCLAFSPEGDKGASGDSTGEVRVWDAQKGKEIATLRPQASPVLALALGPKGELLAVAGDNLVRLLVVDGGRERAVLRGHPDLVLAVALSPDGLLVATGCWDGKVRLWDAQTGKEKAVLSGHAGPVRALAFAPDGKTLASGAGSADRLHLYRVGEVCIWEVAGGKLRGTIQAHPLPIAALAFSKDGLTLRTSTERGPSGTGEMKSWDLAKGNKEKKSYPWPTGAQAAAALPAHAGPLLVACRDDKPFLWNASSATERPLKSYRPGRLLVGGFSPDGLIVALGGLVSFEQMGSAGEMCVWDSATGEPLGRLPEPRAEIHVTALSADGLTAATGYQDGSTRIWNLVTGQARAIPAGGKVSIDAIALDRGGKTLATGDADGIVRLWDAISGELRTTIKGHKGSVSALLFAPEGPLLSAGADGMIRRWDATTGAESGQFRAHEEPIRTLALNQQGTKLVSLGENGTVALWNMDDFKPIGKPFQPVSSVRSLAMAADGKTLALGCRDGTLRIFDIAELRTQETYPIVKGEINSVAFLPKDRGWVCVTSDGVVRLRMRSGSR